MRIIYMLSVLTGDTPVTRTEFIEEMADAGISTSVHFIPLHLHPYRVKLIGCAPKISRGHLSFSSGSQPSSVHKNDR